MVSDGRRRIYFRPHELKLTHMGRAGLRSCPIRGFPEKSNGKFIPENRLIITPWKLSPPGRVQLEFPASSLWI
jgi:hypothetical protein